MHVGPHSSAMVHCRQGLYVPGAPGPGARQGSPTPTMLGDYGMGSLRALAAERTLCCLPSHPEGHRPASRREKWAHSTSRLTLEGSVVRGQWL